MSRDRFRATHEIQLDKSVDFWTVVDATVRLLEKTFRQLPGHREKPKVSLWATDGSHFDRTTLKAAHDAMNRSDLEPSHVFVDQDLRRAIFTATSIAHFRVHAMSGHRTIMIDVNASRKVTSDGIAATVRAFGERVASDPASVVSAETAAQEAERGSRSFGTWITETWREHSVQALIAIVAATIGTVIGTMIGYNI